MKTEDEQLARIKQGLLRNHPYEGNCPHCTAWLSEATVIHPQHGTMLFRSQCGYPAELHPETGS